MKQTPTTFRDSGGRRVSALLTEPDHRTGSAIVLCHGFLSCKDSKTNRRLTELLVPQGFSTFSFDWYGMGETEGDFAEIRVAACCDQLGQALEVLRSQGYPHLGIIGSSFGGYIALLGIPTLQGISAIGLKCPVADLAHLLRTELGVEGMDTWKRTDHVPNFAGGPDPIRLHYAFYEDCCRYAVYDTAESISVPTLIVHGDRDELVPPPHIHRLHQALQGEKKLDLLPEADHYFSEPRDFQNMTGLLAQWMMAHLPPQT